MRFTVSQSSLAKALAVVSKGMASNTTLPILSGVYIKAEAGTLEFQTTNLNVSIRHKVAANVEEEGTTVVSAKTLTNIVKNLPDAAITFNGGDRTISITAGKSSFNLNTLDPNDFPGFPTFALESSVELPCDVLSSMVDRVYKVVSKDTSRPILSGIFMTVESNLIRLVATDSFRLVVCDTTVETSSLEGNFEMIIPGTVFHDVLSLPSDTGSILIGSTDSQVVFVFGNTTYVSRRIEGTFPNHRMLLPSSCETSIKMDVNEFSAALRRVSVIVNPSNSSITFDIDPDTGQIVLSATSPDLGDAREAVAAEITGPNVRIILNYHYVSDCINALSGEKEVVMELQSSMQPAVFKAYATVNYLYLLMPATK